MIVRISAKTRHSNGYSMPGMGAILYIVIKELFHRGDI
jgi:hypothetical protein